MYKIPAVTTEANVLIPARVKKTILHSYITSYALYV